MADQDASILGRGRCPEFIGSMRSENKSKIRLGPVRRGRAGVRGGWGLAWSHDHDAGPCRVPGAAGDCGVREPRAGPRPGPGLRTEAARGPIGPATGHRPRSDARPAVGVRKQRFRAAGRDRAEPGLVRRPLQPAVLPLRGHQPPPGPGQSRGVARAFLEPARDRNVRLRNPEALRRVRVGRLRRHRHGPVHRLLRAGLLRQQDALGPVHASALHATGRPGHRSGDGRAAGPASR
jgi:hypothetical protein